jgi:hypothetical protein
MTLEERLKASKYNNLNATKYSGFTQFVSDTSKLNVDQIPSKYNVGGKLGKLKDTSKLNVDQIPSKYAPK